VCCSVLQCVAECRSGRAVGPSLRSVCSDFPMCVTHLCMLQCVAVCCSVLQCVAVCCSKLQCAAAVKMLGPR